MSSYSARRWVRGAVSRALDGPARWGLVSVCADRLGLLRYRLVVYPPGITVARRRWLRAWRGWPLWGLLLWLACQLVGSSLIDPWAGLALATTLTVSSGIVVFVLAGDARAAVHTMTVVMLAGDAEPGPHAAHRRLEAMARVLIGADKLLGRGQLSLVEHELIWWQVYDLIGTRNSLPAGTSPDQGAVR